MMFALQILKPAVVLLAVSLTCSPPAAAAAAAGDTSTPQVERALKITVLVTNVSGDPHLGDGEWGYSALVEVDGHKILYAQPQDGGRERDRILIYARPWHRSTHARTLETDQNLA
jgi:hypothetical protein